MDNSITAIAQQLLSTKRLLVITGAGISVDSGLPTYRGIGGLYEGSGTEDKLSIEDALSGDMLLQRPEITWKYVHQIEAACRGAHYNNAHKVLVDFEQHFDVCVLTQNIDGFHMNAGSSNVIDIHGDIHDLLCMDCTYSITIPDYSDLNLPPRCPRCDGNMRPDVVLFGEMLAEDKLRRMYAELDQGFDMVVTVGTTSLFPYIAGPVIDASRKNIPTVEINPGDTPVSDYVDHHLRLGAADALTAIWQAYQQQRREQG